MLQAVYYYFAYTIVMKYMPGIKDESGQVDAKLFIASVGSLAGILDGLVSWLIYKNWFAIILSPLMHAALVAAAWFAAKLTPWTRDAAGVPTEEGFIGIAIVLVLFCSGFLNDIKEEFAQKKEKTPDLSQKNDASK